jgi:hypothetical protein
MEFVSPQCHYCPGGHFASWGVRSCLMDVYHWQIFDSKDKLCTTRYNATLIAQYYKCTVSQLLFVYVRCGKEYYTNDYKYAFRMSNFITVRCLSYMHLLHATDDARLNYILQGFDAEFRKACMNPYADNKINLIIERQQEYIDAFNNVINDPHIVKCNADVPDVISSTVVLDIDKQFNVLTRELFDKVVCSCDIPYVEAFHKQSVNTLHWIKVFDDLEFPSKVLPISPVNDVGSNRLVMLMRTHRANLVSNSKAYIDKKINAYFDNEHYVRYIPVVYDEDTKQIVYRYDHSSKEAMYGTAEHVIDSLKLDKNSYLLFDESLTCKKAIPNFYVYPTVLAFMIRTHAEFKTLRSYIHVDEENSTAIMDKCVRLRVRMGTSMTSVRIESFVSNRQTLEYGVKVYQDWSYTIISYYKIDDQNEFKVITSVVSAIFSMYKKYKDMYKILHGIDDSRDVAKSIPSEITNLKREVPELWVSNTSKQVASKTISIISEDQAMELMKRNIQVIRFPIDNKNEHLARWYVSKDPDRPFIGLIRNYKKNGYIHPLLPNVYKRDHLSNPDSHAYKYFHDPNNYDPISVNESRTLVYARDYAPCRDIGMSECPRILSRKILGSETGLKLASFGSCNNRFNETMTSIMGPPVGNVEDYIFMCQQDLPGWSIEDMLRFHRSGYNPMYFVRAYEVVYNTNIVIFLTNRKDLMIYPNIGQYIWKPDMTKSIVVLMCFTSTRTKFIYEAVVRVNDNGMITPRWFKSTEYANIVNLVNEHLKPSTKAFLPQGNIVGQCITKDGKTVAVKMDTGIWMEAFWCPLKAPVYHLTPHSIELPTISQISHVTNYLGQPNVITGNNRVNVVTRKDGNNILVREVEVVEPVMPSLTSTPILREASVFDKYKAFKDYISIKHDTLVSLMKLSSNPIQVIVDYVEFERDEFHYIRGINYLMKKFKWEFKSFEDALNYYKSIGIVNLREKISFDEREADTLESIARSIANKDKVDLLLYNKYLSCQLNIPSYCKFFTSRTSFIDWIQSTDTNLIALDTMKRLNHNYVFNCQVGYKMITFYVVGNLQTTEGECIKYFTEHHPDIVLGPIKVIGVGDLIPKLRNVISDLDKTMILMLYRQGIYAPVLVYECI